MDESIFTDQQVAVTVGFPPSIKSLKNLSITKDRHPVLRKGHGTKDLGQGVGEGPSALIEIQGTGQGHAAEIDIPDEDLGVAIEDHDHPVEAGESPDIPGQGHLVETGIGQKGIPLLNSAFSFSTFSSKMNP